MTDVQVKIELSHRAAPNIYRSNKSFTHDWTVYVKGTAEHDIANFVEKVVFHLYPSYETPTRGMHCVYVSVCVCVCVCMQTNERYALCICLCVHQREVCIVYIYLCVSVCVYMSVCVWVCARVCIVNMSVCVCAPTYMYWCGAVVVVTPIIYYNSIPLSVIIKQ